MQIAASERAMRNRPRGGRKMVMITRRRAEIGLGEDIV